MGKAHRARIIVMSRTGGLLVLVFITLVWGTTFVVIKDALDTISVPLLLAVRFSLAALLLGWVRVERRALGPAMVLGVLGFAGFATQTIGLDLTSASKAAFLTGLSVIFTPLVSSIWLGNRIAPRAYLAAAVALAGLSLMSLTGAGELSAGDLWLLGTAFSYALYIVYLGQVAGNMPVLSLAGAQHWPMALLAWLWALPEAGQLAEVPAGTYVAIAYLALVATVLVAVLQIYAQRVVPAHVAALIFLLEPVFASVFAFFLLGERLGALGWVGGILVIVAMMISELPRRRPRRLRSSADQT
ncbi:MAG: DMT family transporter [Trueperaceae bacterium]